MFATRTKTHSVAKLSERFGSKLQSTPVFHPSRIKPDLLHPGWMNGIAFRRLDYMQRLTQWGSVFGLGGLEEIKRGVWTSKRLGCGQDTVNWKIFDM